MARFSRRNSVRVQTPTLNSTLQPVDLKSLRYVCYLAGSVRKLIPASCRARFGRHELGRFDQPTVAECALIAHLDGSADALHMVGGNAIVTRVERQDHFTQSLLRGGWTSTASARSLNNWCRCCDLHFKDSSLFTSMPEASFPVSRETSGDRWKNYCRIRRSRGVGGGDARRTTMSRNRESSAYDS